MPTIYKTLSLIFIHHLLLLYGIYTYGFNGYVALSIFLITIIYNIIFNGLFVHMRLSHGNYKDNFINVLGTIIWLLTGQTTSPLAFSYVHRVHHKYTDTDLDPHSPKHLGAWRVWFLLWKVGQVNVRYIKDFASSKFQVFLHKHWIMLHVLCVLVFWLINPLIVVFAISTIVVATFNYSGFANVRGHAYGEARDIPEIMLWQPVSWRHKEHHDYDTKTS